MNTSRDKLLTDLEILKRSVDAHNYATAYDYACSVRDDLLKLLEDEMYKGNNND